MPRTNREFAHYQSASTISDATPPLEFYELQRVRDALTSVSQRLDHHRITRHSLPAPVAYQSADAALSAAEFYLQLALEALVHSPRAAHDGVTSNAE